MRRKAAEVLAPCIESKGGGGRKEVGIKRDRGIRDCWLKLALALKCVGLSHGGVQNQFCIL